MGLTFIPSASQLPQESGATVRFHDEVIYLVQLPGYIRVSLLI